MRRIKFEEKLADLAVGKEEFEFISKMFVRHPFAYLRKNGYELPWYQTKYPLERNAIANHFRGEYWIGTFSRYETDYVVIDLDNRKDIEKRYDRVTKVFPYPIVFQSSNSGGLHLYYFIEEAVSTRKMNDAITTKLDDSGIEVAPGKVEVFPALKRGLRIPLGLDSYLLDGDTLIPIHEDLSGAITAFQIEYEPWTIDELLSYRPTESEIAHVTDAVEDCSPHISNTGEFMKEVRGLLEVGLIEPSTRNRAEHMLIYYYWSRGLDEKAVYQKVKKWYLSMTNGMSKDWNISPERVLANLRGSIRRHFEYAKQNKKVPYQGQLFVVESLALSDVRFILNTTNDYKTQQFLFSLLQYAKANEDSLKSLPLAKETILKFSGTCARNYQDRLKFCKNIGLIELAREYHRSAGLSREYTFSYEFTSNGEKIKSLNEGIAKAYTTHVIKNIDSRRISTKILNNKTNIN